MAFDARRLAASLAQQPFEFIGMDGTTYHLPNINSLSGAQARRFMQGDETVIDEVSTPQVVEAIDALPLGVQRELAQAWVRHGGESGKEGSRSSRPQRRRRR